MIKPLIHSMIVCPDMTKNYPVITHGEGAYIFDQSGKRYLDASSGSAAVSNIGHGIDALAKVIYEQTKKISVLPTHSFHSAILEEYLKKLVDYAPKNFSKAWTVMSGTEAVENAMKLALQYHQLRGDKKRFKIIARWGSYHGNSIFTLDVGGMKLRRQAYQQWMNDFPHVSSAYFYRAPEGLTEKEYADKLIEEFEQTIIETGKDSVAAFIVEPVVAAALGAVPPPKGYLKGIKEVCEKHGILFIADEILTGFGRTGKKFGIENFDVVPDIIAVGKGISGGYYPLSAVISKEHVTDVLVKNRSPFLGGHTFSCNPVGAAVGNFVIDYMNEHKIVENANKMGHLFLEKLNTLKKHEIVGDVRGVGLLTGIELVSDKKSKEPFPPEQLISKRISEKALEKGVVLYPGKGSKDGVNGDHIMITPPLIINENDIETIVSVMDSSIKEVMNEIEIPVSNSN